ncbi:class I SAM-dependent methyltransferase [Arenimonas metalli]|nr:class I SAM-dependent methyltransferase [Arenimonas metalli]
MHAELDRTIHPDDAMWRPSERWYFRVGRSALRLVRVAEQVSGLERISSVLDLPCGHGRVSRHLRAAYPDAALYFCDINTGGADFCAQAFRGQAIHSKPELTEVDLPQVDLIWVGSLFTHVDIDRTRRWLHYLCERLNPGGVLVATVHGPWSQRMHEAHYPMIDPDTWQRILASYQTTGYGYAPYPGGAIGDYGISLSTSETIIGLVRGIPGVRLAGYLERGWADNHDVVMIAKEDRDRPWTPDFPV